MLTDRVLHPSRFAMLSALAAGSETSLADYLLKQPHGGETIRTMIIDDIHKALDGGRVKHAQALFMALRHFLARTGVEA